MLEFKPSILQRSAFHGGRTQVANKYIKFSMDRWFCVTTSQVTDLVIKIVNPNRARIRPRKRKLNEIFANSNLTVNLCFPF